MASFTAINMPYYGALPNAPAAMPRPLAPDDTEDPVTRKVSQLWQEWPRIKDTVAYFGFSDYIQGEFGFIYGRDMQVTQTGVKHVIKVVEIINQEKYAWFLLHC